MRHKYNTVPIRRNNCSPVYVMYDISLLSKPENHMVSYGILRFIGVCSGMKMMIERLKLVEDRIDFQKLKFLKNITRVLRKANSQKLAIYVLTQQRNIKELYKKVQSNNR